MTQEHEKSSNELAVVRTDLAIERNVMAANRTLMAWVRTDLSMISFGFTIYKFLMAEAAKIPNLDLIQRQRPERLGVVLIGIGTVAMILGTIEYMITMKQLSTAAQRPYKPWSFTVFVGILIGLLGLFLFITIIINKEIF